MNPSPSHSNSAIGQRRLPAIAWLILTVTTWPGQCADAPPLVSGRPVAPPVLNGRAQPLLPVGAAGRLADVPPEGSFNPLPPGRPTGTLTNRRHDSNEQILRTSASAPAVVRSPGNNNAVRLISDQRSSTDIPFRLATATESSAGADDGTSAVTNPPIDHLPPATLHPPAVPVPSTFEEPPSVPLPSPIYNRNLDEELDRRQRERLEGYQRLQQQLERLSNTLHAQREAARLAAEQAAQQKAAQQKAVPPKSEPPIEPAPPEETPPPVDVTEPEATEPNSGGVPPEMPPDQPPAPASVFADSLSSKVIVDGPVDRLGLADNLFALKEFRIALEMYGQIDLEPLSESERFWVSYQKACCHRRLGQIPEAQEIYRRLAGQKRGGWIARLSRWWLDQIDSRSELELQISKYETVLKKLMEDAEQNQNP